MELSWEAPAQSDIEKYRVWRKGLLKWEQLEECKDRNCLLTTERVGKTASLSVTAIDADGLESLYAEPVKVDTRIVGNRGAGDE